MEQNDKMRDTQAHKAGTELEKQFHFDQIANHAERERSLTTVPVRFAPLRGQARPPAGYMYVEEAINTLGPRLHPKEWGVGSAWKEQPFRYSRKEKSYVRYCLEKTRKGFRLRRDPINPCLSRDKLKSASRTYAKVCNTLKSALEEGFVTASKMDRDGYIEPISNSQKGLWARKNATIFYTGEFRETRDGKQRKYRVLIDRQSFKTWLAEYFDRGPNKHQRSPRALLNTLASLLTNHAKTKDYIPSKAELFDVLSGTLNELSGQEHYLTEYTFQEHFWRCFAPGKKKSGRRPAAMQDAFKRDRSEFEMLIRQEYIRRQGNPASEQSHGKGTVLEDSDEL